MALNWKIDECGAYHDRMRLSGWAFQGTPRITHIEAVFPDPAAVVPLRSYGLASPDVAAGVDPAATHARFDEWISAPPEALGYDFALRFTFEDGTTATGGSALGNATAGDPYFGSFVHFISQLGAFSSGTVLEIGSRARSALTNRQHIPPHLDYVGLDILPGPNVDVVGDAHRLAEIFAGRRFVAAMSFSVFEHLAMPWKVALELNRVLEPGGLVYSQTHHTWPLHEEPWDFWRFSQHSWQTLFNAATGFEVVQAVCGEPARIHACRSNPVTRDLPNFRNAYLGSASIVRKISDTALTWPVPVEVAARDSYPAGELKAPPIHPVNAFQRA
ncbi:MAG: methyltransferase domain-containing protein [Opitutaceae bacterium]|nr:methyltransferase domain-containing protein [Opitutaceae bacterium]